MHREWAKALTVLSQIGITIAACLLIGVGGGLLLDRFFGTLPWIMIAGSILGVIAAFRSILELIPKDGDKEDK